MGVGFSRNPIPTLTLPLKGREAFRHCFMSMRFATGYPSTPLCAKT
jgi:hypothetical protein